MFGPFRIRFFTSGYEKTMREISTMGKKAKASRKMHKKKRSKKKKQ